MKSFDKFGVQELTRPEQREILGGEGFFYRAGYFMGSLFGSLFEWLEEAADETWLRQTGDWREGGI